MARLLLVGDKAECAKLLPFARKQLRALARVRGPRGGPKNRTLRVGDALIRLTSARSYESIYIDAGRLTYEWYAAPDDSTDVAFRARVAGGVSAREVETPRLLDATTPDHYLNTWYLGSVVVTSGAGARYNTGTGAHPIVDRIPQIVSPAGITSGPEGSEVSGAAIQGPFCVGIDSEGTLKVWNTGDASQYVEQAIDMPDWFTDGTAYWNFDRSGYWAIATAADDSGGIAAVGYIQVYLEIEAEEDGSPSIGTVEVGANSTITGLIAMDYAWDVQPASLESGQQDVRYAYITGWVEEFDGGSDSRATWYFNLHSVTDGLLLSFPVRSYNSEGEAGDRNWTGWLEGLDLRCNAYLFQHTVGTGSSIPVANRNTGYIRARAFGAVSYAEDGTATLGEQDSADVTQENYLVPTEYNEETAPAGFALPPASLGSWVSIYIPRAPFDCIPTLPASRRWPWSAYLWTDFLLDEAMELDVIRYRRQTVGAVTDPETEEVTGPHRAIYEARSAAEGYIALPDSPADDQGAMVVGLWGGK